MRVFMTGATGYIGAAVASALVNSGHQVAALSRSAGSASALRASGVEVVEGSLEEIGFHESFLSSCDGAIHVAAAKGEHTSVFDRKAVDFFTRHARGMFIYTSGVWILGNTGESEAGETTAVDPLPIVAWRPTHERLVIEANREELRTAVIRPGCVYGSSQGLFAPWFEAAREGNSLDMVGQGTNRWATVYLDDAADCYLKVLESGNAGVFHAIDDSRATIVEIARGIAESAGKGSHVRMRSLEESRTQLGPFADALAIDQQVSSSETRRRLDWSPSSDSILGTIERQWEEWLDSIS